MTTEEWDFSANLDNPEIALATKLRTDWPMLYWLMRVGASCLEVGAGSGRTSILLKRLQPYRRVAVCDISQDAVRVMKQMAAKTQVDIDVYHADTLALPFGPGAFDIVFSSGVLEHFTDEDIIRALAEQGRVAEVVLVSVPLDFYVANFRIHGDERPLPSARWCQLFQIAGMAIADMCLDGPPTEQYWLRALLVPQKGGG